MAQALLGFPPLQQGGGVLEYVLSFEKLVSEYEQLSGSTYPDELKLSTLLKGLPAEIKRWCLLTSNVAMDYTTLRDHLLEYEKSTASWTSDHILKSAGLNQTSSQFGLDGP